ncbi:MAG TPA: hypothetical protein VK797_03125 [Tepidisphaeraceae bacterium]|jgi:hypothetical protein|nr:hypothetical protein [Tepidisphaeraceae bacterium]
MDVYAVNQRLFVPPNVAAERCGVPEKWLREQAAKGVLPSLRIGRVMLFNEDLLRSALLKLALAESARQTPPA